MECYLVGEDAGEGWRAASGATVVERLGFVSDVWPARVLESGARQGILNFARQCGQRGQLKIAEGLNGGEQLMREMAGMRVRVTASGREEYGAWRAGEHDDLVVRWRWRAGAGRSTIRGMGARARGMRSGRGWRVGSGIAGRWWEGWCRRCTILGIRRPKMENPG